VAPDDVHDAIHHAGAPASCTIETAHARSVIAYSMSHLSILNVSGQMSANAGIVLRNTPASAV
jgi:hypothetical protein